jgi:methionyl-tRNA formyltransferase
MRVVFAGSGDIGVPTLNWLMASSHDLQAVVTQPDRPMGRHQEIEFSCIKKIALSRGIPVLQPGRIRDPDAVRMLADFAPQVLVVIAYGQILPRTVLELPSVASLNLHASLLPKHRGAAPIQAAIESGDHFSGVTVMYMAEGLDTGDVLLQESLPIRRRETGGSLHTRLADLAPRTLKLALELLEDGSAPRIPQDHAMASYAGKLGRENGRIAWSSPDAVDRRVRAMNPWPGAYTVLPPEFGGRKLKVFSVIKSRARSGGAFEGTILAVEKRGILVAAGQGAVWLGDVQLEGKRRLHATEFSRGTPLTAGSILGVAGLP